MKKVLKSLALTGSMLAIAATAQAVNTVQVTLTSPSIIKVGCEQFGSYTVTFDKGTQLTEGDWFYMDLPLNTSICKPIDYFIVGNRDVGATGLTSSVTYDATVSTTDVVLNGTATTIPILGYQSLGIPETVGPITYANDSPLSETLNGGTGIVLRVYAPNGGRRVWVYVYGADTLTSGTDALLVDNVGQNAKLTLHLLDGLSYNDDVTGNIILNTGGGTTWGDSATDDISNLKNVPHVEDTLCADASNPLYTNELVSVSYSSLNSFLTFTGDSQIAHVNSVDGIFLESCNSTGGKGGIERILSGDILVPDTQSGGCEFDYETPYGYCSNGFTGNHVILKAVSSTSFGDPGNRFDMSLTSTTPGVYWSSANVVLQGYTSAQHTTALTCAAPGALIAPSPGFTGNSTGFNAGTCSIGSGEQASVISTNASGAITGLNVFDSIWVDMPPLVYNKTTVNVGGIESEVRIDIVKYPCGGSVFSDTRVLGTFVTSCPTAPTTGMTTMLYPFLPPMDGSIAGWWGGFTIVNASATDSGTCTLTITDEENDSATYTTPTIVARGQWNPGGMMDFMNEITSVSGNVADANISIIADCNFSLGGGFAFTGNGNEGTGYTAYILSGNAWQ